MKPSGEMDHGRSGASVISAPCWSSTGRWPSLVTSRPLASSVKLPARLKYIWPSSPRTWKKPLPLMARSRSLPVGWNWPAEKSVVHVDHFDAAADVVDRLVARRGEALLNGLGEAGLKRRHVLLEADRVDVRQVVGDDFEALRLGGGTLGRDVHSVRHGCLSEIAGAPPCVRPTILSNGRAEATAVARELATQVVTRQRDKTTSAESVRRVSR